MGSVGIAVMVSIFDKILKSQAQDVTYILLLCLTCLDDIIINRKCPYINRSRYMFIYNTLPHNIPNLNERSCLPGNVQFEQVLSCDWSLGTGP